MGDISADPLAVGDSRLPQLRDAPPLKFHTILLFGLGSVSNGVKSKSLSAFLLLFYNQIMGVSAVWIGTAMAVILIVDGFVDPVIGQISDNFRSRWGRRHPFMYASAIPYAGLFYLVWTPPSGWSDSALLAYMIVTVMLLRSVDTLFEVPAAALAPELSEDYHQRTTLVSFRYFFTYGGGLVLAWVAYTFFLNESASNPQGLFGAIGYQRYALVASIVIALAILISTAGTVSRIPWLKRPPARSLTARLMVREIIETLSNRSLWVANAAGLFTAIATGFIGTLSTYFQIYFWELDASELSYLTIGGIAAAFVGVFLVPRITRSLGKKRAALLMLVVLMIISITPVSLRLLGLLPSNDSPAVLALVVAEVTLIGALTLMTTIAITSMIIDVVEDSEVKTGRRSEGLLVSVDNIVKKAVAGAGVFSAGLVIAFAGMPENARPGQVPADTLETMGLLYVPCIIVIYLGAVLSLLAYRLDESSHEANLQILRDRAASDA